MNKRIFYGMRISLMALMLGLCVVSCGGDDDDDDDVVTTLPDSDSTGGNNGTGSTVKLNLVGKSYSYYSVGTEFGYQHTISVTLSFLSSTQCKVSKDCDYYQWKNGAYRPFKYNGSKTVSYVVASNKVTIKGAWPFWSGTHSEKWENDSWNLTYDPEYPYVLTAEDGDDGGCFSLIN